MGGSAAMKPNGTSVKMLLYTENKLRLLHKSNTDILLCSYLLDRNIDAFAKAIVKISNLCNTSNSSNVSNTINNTCTQNTITRSLPKHYREALILYTHLRSNPIVVFHDDIIDADYRDYQEMERKYANSQERQTMLRDTYGKTYWYYYDYQ